MSVTNEKFRILKSDNLKNKILNVSDANIKNYDDDVLMIDTSIGGIYLGNGTKTPTLIANKTNEVSITDLSEEEITNIVAESFILIAGSGSGSGMGIDEALIDEASLEEGEGE